jgi:hypothetical protein
LSSLETESRVESGSGEHYVSVGRSAGATEKNRVALFTPNGAFWETPFGPPEVGSEAMHQGWDELWPYQRDRHMRAEVLAVEGDTALARWWATYTRLPDKIHRELDGILLLRFADDSRCRELIEWRHARDDGAVVST